MQYWLIKSEPGTYAWGDLVRDGETSWDGVRNFQARNNIRAMKPGDSALYYHSGKEKSVVGVAVVVSQPYADASADGGDWTAIDVAPSFALKKRVTLDAIKAEKALCEMVLVKQSQLSVQPARKGEFSAIVALGGRRAL